MEALTPELRARYKKLAADAGQFPNDVKWAQGKLDEDEKARQRYIALARDPNAKPDDAKWALSKLGTHWGDQGLPLTPDQKSRVDRESAAGQTAPPTFGDKLEEAGKGAVAGARAGALGAADEFSFGLIPKALEGVGIIDEGTRERLNQETSTTSDSMVPKWATSENLGRISGGVLSGVKGPGRVLAAPARSLLAQVERRLPALAEKGFKAGAGRLLARTAEGAVAGGTYGGANALARGESVGEGALQGGEQGAEIAGALNLVSPLLARAYGGIRASKGGQARELLNEHGVTVGPTTPGKGGVLDKELAGLEPGKRAVGDAARRGAVGVLEPLESDYKTNVSEPHTAARAQISASPEGKALRDISPLIDELETLSSSGKLLPGEASTVSAILKRYRGMAIPEEAPQRMPVVGERQAQTPLKGYPGDAPEFRAKPVTPNAKPPPTPQVSETELNEMRQALGRASDVGATGNQSVPKAELDNARRTAKELVDKGPFAETNRKYAEGTTDYEESRRMLGLERDANGLRSPEGPVESDLESLKNALMDRGRDTASAGGRGPGIDQFRAKHPGSKLATDMPRIAEARQDLEFRGPSGLGGAALGMGMPLGAAYVAHSLGGGSGLAAGLGGGALALGARNAAPIAGRMLYGPAKAAAQLGAETTPLISSFIPEIEQIIARAHARADAEKKTAGRKSAGGRP